MINVSQKLFTSLGQAHEFELAMLKQKVTSAIVQDVIDGKISLSFAPVSTPTQLSFKQLLSWLRKNNLDLKLSGGLEGQLAEQEVFYQNVCGKSFYLDRKKISVDVRRLPAIRAGLESGCLNYALVYSTTESQMTDTEFAFERIMKPLKKDGLKLWAETGTDRWTNLTLAELLQRCNSVELEDFDIEAFKQDWVAEVIRASGGGLQPKRTTGKLEIIFTSNAVDISSNQIIINEDGEIVTPNNRSYVEAIACGVRVLSHAEGIVLASQMFAKDKTYLAPNTWEWRRDLIDHRDKGASPGVSVALVRSYGSEFKLHSSSAGNSGGGGRLRLAL